MTGFDLLLALNDLDDDLVESGALPPKKKTFPYKYLGLAACIALVLVGIFVYFHLSSRNKPIPNELFTNANIAPEQVGGSPITGDLYDPNSIGKPLSAPSFEFGYGFVVIGNVTQVLPDIYYIPEYDFEDSPVSYQILQIEVAQVVSGTGVPDQILYMIPSYLVTNIDSYETLLISMVQFGYEDMVLWNFTTQKMERFPLVFYNGWPHPQLGNIIAFTDGIFDESLWQNKEWFYGYQFAQGMLDKEYEGLIVKRGCTLDYTLSRIREYLDNWENYTPPTVRRYAFQTEEANALMAKMRSFEHGVYALMDPYPFTSYHLTFRRFVNGCATNEVIQINLETEQITYSDYAFTQEDLAHIANLAQYIQSVQPDSSEDIPSPSRFSTKGLDLFTFGRFGWYEKTDSGVYGIVKTTWLYRDMSVKYQYTWYYDESYLLFDMEKGTMREVSRKTLKRLIGENRNIYNGNYGVIYVSK